MVTAAVIPKMILVMKPLVAVRDAVVGFTLLRRLVYLPLIMPARSH